MKAMHAVAGASLQAVALQRLAAKTFPGDRGLAACSEKPKRVCRVRKKVRMYRGEVMRKRHQDPLGIEDP